MKCDRFLFPCIMIGLLAGCAVPQPTSVAVRPAAPLALVAPNRPPAPRDFVAEAEACVKARDTAGALALLDQAIAADPGSAAAFAKRGELKLRSDPAAAIRDYTRVLEIDPHNVQALRLRGALYWQVDNVDAAMTDLNAAIAADSAHPMAYRYRSLAWISRHDYERAAADAESFVQRDNTSSVGWDMLGTLQAARGHHARAVGSFNRALSYDPTLTECYLKRGDAQRRTGEFAAARADYVKYLLLQPKSPERAYYGLVFVAKDERDADAGVPACTEYLTRFPDTPDSALVHRIRSAFFVTQGDLESAERDLDANVRKEAKVAAAYALRATLRRQRGNLAGVIEDLNEAIRLSPASGTYFKERADAKADRGDLVGAVADYDRSIELSSASVPNHADALVRRVESDTTNAVTGVELGGHDLRLRLARGIARRVYGDWKGGWKDLNIVAEAEPLIRGRAAELAFGPHGVDGMFALVFLERGRAAQRAGRFEAAAADIARAESLGADPAEVHAVRGRLNKSAGELPRALTELNRAIEHDAGNGWNFYERAQVRYALGDLDGALSDFHAAGARVPSNLYVPFFTYVTLRRLGRDPDVDGLKQKVATWKATWPRNIGRFLTGQLDENALLTFAEAAGPQVVDARRCEAYFYVGIEHMLRGEGELAAGWLTRCLATEQTTYYEYFLAGVELERLKQQRMAGGR